MLRGLFLTQLSPLVSEKHTARNFARGAVHFKQLSSTTVIDAMEVKMPTFEWFDTYKRMAIQQAQEALKDDYVIVSLNKTVPDDRARITSLSYYKEGQHKTIFLAPSTSLPVGVADYYGFTEEYFGKYFSIKKALTDIAEALEGQKCIFYDAMLETRSLARLYKGKPVAFPRMKSIVDVSAIVGMYIGMWNLSEKNFTRSPLSSGPFVIEMDTRDLAYNCSLILHILTFIKKNAA